MEDNKQLEVDTEVSAEVVNEEVAEAANDTAAPTAPVAEVATENKSFMKKIKDFFKHINWKVVYDKTTTGILIFLLSSPILILLYIFLWFILK